MIATIFETISSAVTAFAGSLGNAVTSIGEMFVTHSGDTYSLTFLGTLSLIAVGVGLVYWGFRLIRGLIAQRRA